MHWNTIQQWFAEEDLAIAQEYDSITLWTGDEGVGKSETMLAVNYVKSKGAFTIGDVHFDEDEGMAYCIKQPPGKCVQFDELDGHRRLAMTKKRMRMLKFLKERRSLCLRIGIAFPHVDQLERDILNSRVRYWVHIPERGLLLVHRRRSRIVNKQGEEPMKVVDFPLVGRFRVDKPEGPLVAAYRQKKYDFTHREDDLIQDLPPPRRIDVEAARPVLEKLRAIVAPQPVAVNEAFFDQVLDDLKRP